MFRVLVVDDEPAALAFICSLVAQRWPGFQVVGTAGNGQECLDMLRETPADVVLSDVRMPVMDGVELGCRLKEAHPEVITLMISGHQEFDYVRGALHNGVHDYLLKPLTPSAFGGALERLRLTLEARLRARRNRMLQQLSKGEQVDARELRACFPDGAYDCVLVRRNGLPKRFARAAGPEIYSEWGESLTIFGRDEMERICLRPTAPDLDAYVEQIMAQEAEGGYVTAVLTRQPFEMAQFQDMLQRLYRALDVRTVLGLTQAVYLDDPFSRPRLPLDASGALAELESLMQAGQQERARAMFRDLMLDWDARRMPQLWLERQLRYIVYLVRRVDGGGRLEGLGEHLLDDAFFSIACMEDMIVYMDGLLFECANTDSAPDPRLDSPDTFERIAAYVRAHFSEPLTLSAISQTFGISQSYVSKLFRKYAQHSFNAFLTQTRMECAKKLLQSGESSFVKDIAETVGYTDPFYFSRAFRAYTGTSPKDYIERARQEG